MVATESVAASSPFAASPAVLPVAEVRNAQGQFFLSSAWSWLQPGFVSIAVCFFLLIGQAAFAQQCVWPDPPINCGNRKSLAQLWEEAAGAKMDMTRQIAEARAKFWGTYPNKPGFAEARDKFSELLNSKDIYYLNTYISAQRMNLPNSPGLDQVAGGMDRVFGGVKIDDGIPDTAEWAFRQWAIQFKDKLDEAGGVLSRTWSTT